MHESQFWRLATALEILHCFGKKCTPTAVKGHSIRQLKHGIFISIKSTLMAWTILTFYSNGYENAQSYNSENYWIQKYVRLFCRVMAINFTQPAFMVNGGCVDGS